MYCECEIKLPIESVERKNCLIEKVNQAGYVMTDSRMETDVIADTDDCKLRKNGILFRIREERSTSNCRILFTVKIKRKSDSFQVNDEIEMFSDDFQENVMREIVCIVNRCTGIEIPAEFFRILTIANVEAQLGQLAFHNINIVQKKRIEYRNSASKITFDMFPDPIGDFLEIETDSEELLQETINTLQLDDNKTEKRNYGQIIREKVGDVQRLLFQGVGINNRK